MADDNVPGSASATGEEAGRCDERPVSVSTETVFELLADRRRRAVLAALRQSTDDAATVRELSVAVSSRARDVGPPRRVAVTLHHSVLPKLADAGLIEYDARSNAVRYRQQPKAERLLDAVEAD